MTGRFPSRQGVTTATPLTKTYYNQGMENVKAQYFPTLNPDYNEDEDTRPYPFKNLWKK